MEETRKLTTIFAQSAGAASPDECVFEVQTGSSVKNFDTGKRCVNWGFTKNYSILFAVVALLRRLSSFLSMWITLSEYKL